METWMVPSLKTRSRTACSPIRNGAEARLEHGFAASIDQYGVASPKRRSEFLIGQCAVGGRSVIQDNQGVGGGGPGAAFFQGDEDGSAQGALFQIFDHRGQLGGFCREVRFRLIGGELRDDLVEDGLRDVVEFRDGGTQEIPALIDWDRGIREELSDGGGIVVGRHGGVRG